MRGHYKILVAITLVLLAVFSCDKGEEKDENPTVISCFTYTANGATITFNSSCSEGAESYDWEFGDGRTSINPNPTNTYIYSGSYEVTLRVTGNGNAHTAVQTIDVVGSVCKTCFCGPFYSTDSCGTELEVTTFCAECLSQGGPCTRCE